MVVSKLQKRAGFSFAVLLLVCVITRILIELGFGTTASRKFLEWGTSVFDKMFEVLTAQAESFQTESQLVIGAALVSGMVKALEAAGTENRPLWVAARRVFAIVVASVISIGALLAFMGTWVLLLGLAVGEDLIAGAVVLKTFLAFLVTIPTWMVARKVLAIFTAKGPMLSREPVTSSDELEGDQSDPAEPSDSSEQTGILVWLQAFLGRP